MGSERIVSPGWGFVREFKYQFRCGLCHELRSSRFEREFCDVCVKKLRRG